MGWVNAQWHHEHEQRVITFFLALLLTFKSRTSDLFLVRGDAPQVAQLGQANDTGSHLTKLLETKEAQLGKNLEILLSTRSSYRTHLDKFSLWYRSLGASHWNGEALEQDLRAASSGRKSLNRANSAPVSKLARLTLRSRSVG